MLGGEDVGIMGKKLFFFSGIEDLTHLYFFPICSWCKPCKKIQPFYERLSAQYRDKALSFLTVDVDDFDAISTKYKVGMMPTFLVLQNDEVLGTLRGSGEPQLESFLKEQLAQK
jgi:thioredoxin 1